MPLSLPSKRLLDGPAAAEAIRIIGRLRERGFVAYLAGGCVRDALLGLVPKDYDVATDATPDAVRECFGRRRTLAFGASFGVIGVLPEKSDSGATESPLTPTEVATFRSDGEYSDGRRPDSVHFGSAEQDALRRDFTINGLFYDPLQQRVIDFVGGQADLQSGLLRTIGSATARFAEDKLRMLRAVRFATTLDVTIEPETFEAIRQHAADIHAVSGERIGAEMRRVLTAPRAAVGLGHLSDSELAQLVLPEWERIDQSRASELLNALNLLPPARDSHARFCGSLALLLLTHTNAPTSLSAIVNRWKLANDEQRPASFALENWSSFANADQLPWSELQPLLIDRDRDVALQVARAFVTSNRSTIQGIDRCFDAIQWPIAQLDPPPLLTGHDLQQIGIEPGPIFRKILERVRNGQLDGEIQSFDEAQTLARRIVID